MRRRRKFWFYYIVLSLFCVGFVILYVINQPKKNSLTFPEIESSLRFPYKFPEFQISMTFPWQLSHPVLAKIICLHYSCTAKPKPWNRLRKRRNRLPSNCSEPVWYPTTFLETPSCNIRLHKLTFSIWFFNILAWPPCTLFQKKNKLNSPKYSHTVSHCVTLFHTVSHCFTLSI